MSLDKAIIEAVEQSLPSIQVKAIHKALDELEELREYKADTKENLACLRRDFEAEQISNLELRQQREADTATIEGLKAELTQAQDENRTAEVSKIQAALDAVERTTDKFLKNTIYREEVQRHMPVSDSGTSYQYVNGVQQPTPYSRQSNIQVTDVKKSGNDLESDPTT